MSGEERRREKVKAEQRRNLFTEYRKTRDGAVRDQLIALHINLVKYIAGRYANRGEPMEDLVQVGCVGLIKAVECFDPGLDNVFSTYAVPTIMGEIKRYFRDKGSAFRVPRSLQELRATVKKAREDLTHRLQRSPTVNELAAEVEASEEKVLECLEFGQLVYLNADVQSNDERSYNLAEFLGAMDHDIEATEDRVMLSQALSHLPPREQMILHLLFNEGTSQAEAARMLQISQMHVSRLRSAALQKLQRLLGDGERLVAAG